MKTIELKTKVEVPDWAEWIAQDKDGQWAAYSSKPTAIGDLFWGASGHITKIELENNPNPAWRETLREV